MHQNSLNVYHNEVKPTLRRRQLQVLKVYQKVGEGTARDIMAITGQTSNVIHPRIGELRDLGYLKEIGNKKIDKHNHAILKITEKGLAINTDEVKDIVPAKRYYSKEDYRHFCRNFYDYISPKISEENKTILYKQLQEYLTDKK